MSRWDESLWAALTRVVGSFSRMMGFILIKDTNLLPSSRGRERLVYFTPLLTIILHAQGSGERDALRNGIILFTKTQFTKD